MSYSHNRFLLASFDDNTTSLSDHRTTIEAVAGPNTHTDNAIPRFDGTTGNDIQNSNVTIADTGQLTAPFYTTNGNVLTVSSGGSIIETTPAAIQNPAQGTGVLTGGVLSTASATTFDITDGTGLITNPSTGVITEVSWSGLTGQSTSYTGRNATWVCINSGGTVSYKTSPVTDAQTRDEIFLGVLNHSDGINLDNIENEQMVLVSTQNQIRDFMNAVGYLNLSGNLVSSDSLLTIKKTSGVILKFGANYANDVKDPHQETLGALNTNVSDDFIYRMRDGSSSSVLTSHTANIKDDGTAYPGTTYANNNRWGVHRIYITPANKLEIQPTQDDYKTEAEAVNSIQDGSFIVEATLASDGILLGYLVNVGNATDLTDTAQANFFNAGKYGTSIGGAAGGFQDLQSVYNNTTAQPEILTDSTRGALTIQRGSGADTDNVLEIQNGAGTITAYIQGDGTLDLSNNITLTGTVDGVDIAARDALSVINNSTSTDNAIAKFDSTTGKIVQDTGVIIDDSNNISGIVNITLTGTVDGVDIATRDGLSVINNSTSTDNAIPKFDSTTGKIVQNSGVIIDDSNNITGVGTLGTSGAITASAGGISATNGDITAVNGSMNALTNIAAVNGSVSAGTTVSSTTGMTAGNTLTVTAGITTLNDDLIMRTGVLDLTEATTSATSIGTEFALQKFSGYDGTSFDTGALIRCTASQTWSGSTRGTVMDFRTNASGETAALGTSRMQIDATGDVYVNQDLFVSENLDLTGKILVDSGNVRIGSATLDAVTTGANNIAIGNNALDACTTGAENVAIGSNALGSLTTSNGNFGLGTNALLNCVTGGSNVAVGRYALQAQTNSNSVGIGQNALLNTTGISNVGVGYNSGQNITTGGYNTCVGDACAAALTTGSQCVTIGWTANVAATLGYQTAIGSAAVTDEANMCSIGNTSINVIRPGSDDLADLGQSDFRFDNIFATNSTIQTSDSTLKDIDEKFEYGLDFINQIKCIQYRWKNCKYVDADTNEVKTRPGVRTHLGIDASQIGELIETNKIPDFGGFIKPEKKIRSGVEVIPNLGFRYNELIAPLIASIQELTKRIEVLEGI